MISDSAQTVTSDTNQLSTRVYAVRSCPACGSVIFGMPGGRDAHCTNCGFKDPCCSD